MRNLVLALTALTVAACVSVNTVEVRTVPSNDQRVVLLTQRLVADQMRDPESTRFRGEAQVYETSAGDHIVCGMVNARNAMGGYVGYRQFYARIRNGALAAFNVPGEGQDYVSNYIAQECAKAESGTIMVSS
jgi:hypothetical protein